MSELIAGCPQCLGPRTRTPFGPRCGHCDARSPAATFDGLPPGDTSGGLYNVTVNDAVSRPGLSALRAHTPTWEAASSYGSPSNTSPSPTARPGESYAAWHRRIYDAVVSAHPDARIEPATLPSSAAMLGEVAAGRAQSRDDASRREGYAQGIARSMGVVAEYGSDMVRASDLYERLEYLKHEAEARDAGLGDSVESRVCSRDGHRWSEGRCVFCGADRVSEERRGGPAVERAADDNACPPCAVCSTSSWIERVGAAGKTCEDCGAPMPRDPPSDVG